MTGSEQAKLLLDFVESFRCRFTLLAMHMRIESLVKLFSYGRGAFVYRYDLFDDVLPPDYIKGVYINEKHNLSNAIPCIKTYERFSSFLVAFYVGDITPDTYFVTFNIRFDDPIYFALNDIWFHKPLVKPLFV